LIFDAVLKSSSFWDFPYSDYRGFLVETIFVVREKDMSYGKISEWLNAKGYGTPRENPSWLAMCFLSTKRKSSEIGESIKILYQI